MMVNRDVLEVAFGYRKASIINITYPAILGGEEILSTAEAKLWARKVESMWQDIIAIEKVQIVLKTPDVFMSNMTSNSIFVMAQYNIHPKRFLRDTQEAINAMATYQDNEDAYIQEMAKMEAGLDYSENKIIRLRDAMDKSPVNGMVKAGLFQGIVEDIDTNNFKSNNGLSAAITEKANRYLGGTVTGAFRTINMNEGTKPFNMALKATQYSDFTARYVVMKKLMEDGMPEAEALVKVADMFINYNKQNAIMLQYMNDMGFVMFTNFWLRIQPVIAATMRDKPASAMMTIIMQSLLWDMEDINDSSLLEKDLDYVIKANPFAHLFNAFVPAITRW